MSNNEKPYIEYNGTKYEFEADLKLQREYNKCIQKLARKLVYNGTITEEKQKTIEDFETEVKSGKYKDLPIEKVNEDKELKEKLLLLEDVNEAIDFSSVYDEFCFKMLEKKYSITREEFDLMLEGFGEEYGIEFIDVMLEKVCEKVFTRGAEKKKNQPKKTLPSFMTN